MLFLVAAERTAAQLKAEPVSCVLTNSCPPPPPPKPIDINLISLLNAGIVLVAPIDNSGLPTQYDPDSAQSMQGGWAAQVIQQNTNNAPPLTEALNLSNPLVLLADAPLTNESYQYPGLPLKFITNPSVIFHVPILLNGNSLPPPTFLYGPPPVGFVAGEGLYGVYWARVEDCLSTTDHPQLNPSVDFAGKPIPCANADGIPGNAGQWYDIAPVWGATATLGPSPVLTWSGSEWIVTGASQKGTLQIPAQLPVPTNSLRIEFALGLADTPNGSFINSLAWFTGQSCPTCFLQTSCCNTALTRFALNLPPISVLPAAFAQMKVLPYTILYRPPGDLSSATFSVTRSFSTNMSVGQSTTIDQTGSFAQSAGITRGELFSAMISFMAGFQVGGQQGSSSNTMNMSAFDTNTTVGYGITGVNSSTGGFTFPVGGMIDVSDPTIFPALTYVVPNTCSPTTVNYSLTCTSMPPETYQQQPFWADEIVLLLHPQTAIWSLNGMTASQLVGSSGAYDTVSVIDLQTCATNSSTASAFPLINGDYLSPSECQELLSLDPFYGPGQSLDPSVSGRGTSALQQTGLGFINYGRDPLNPTAPLNPTSLQNNISYSIAQSTNATASYNATVTAVLGFSWSSGQNLTFQGNFGTQVGGSNGPMASAGGNAGTTVALTNGAQSTYSTSQKITYSASTVATQTDSTGIVGFLNDDHDLYTPACRQNSMQCKQQSTKIFIDELFGSFMFQDPNATCNTAYIPLCRVIVIVRAAPVTAASKSSQSKLTALPPAESTAVVSLRTIFQQLYSYNLAHPSQGYPSSLTEVDPSLARRGIRGGYHITYIPKASTSGGKIDTYQVLFDPLNPIKSKSLYFFMDETGTIRSSQTGPANAQSSKLQ